MHAQPTPELRPQTQDAGNTDMLTLPDPFRFEDGNRVAARNEWLRRREEIKDLLLRQQYGRIPPAPDRITALETSREDLRDGAGVRRKVMLTMGPPELSMRLTLTAPPGDGPFPVIVRNVRETEIRPTSPEIIALINRRGYALAEYLCSDLQADETALLGPAKTAYPDHDWGTLAVWAWGGMRTIDYLLTRPDVEAARIVVTGHSRGGKTALLTGALDDRVALTVSNGTGGGGFQCWRFPIHPDDPPGAAPHESVAVMTPLRTYWFHPRLNAFAGRVGELPYDQHFLAALVAPRALCAVECLDDFYATPLCAQRTFWAAQTVYAWMGAENALGIYFRESGGHAQGNEDWTALLDFADAYFRGQPLPRAGRFNELPYPQADAGFSWRAPADDNE